MNTKTRLVTLLCLLCCSVPPALAQAADPPQIIELRASYEKQMQDAIAPAQAAYLTALEALRQQLTRDNKVDAALCVDSEIKRIKGERTTPTKAPADPPELVARRTDYHRTVSRLLVSPLTAYLRALDPIKQQSRKDGQLEIVLAVDKEIKAVSEKLKTAQTGTGLHTASLAQVQIESVVFGDPKTKKTRDATAAVRAAFESGAATIALMGKDLRTGDPAPGTSKVAVITYTVNGKRKEKTFPAGTNLDFKKELR